MATKLALGKSKAVQCKSKNPESIHNEQKCSLTIIIKFSARKNDRKKPAVTSLQLRIATDYSGSCKGWAWHMTFNFEDMRYQG